MTGTSIPAGTHIGHVHRTVADLDRALAYSRDRLGFDLLLRIGDQAAFLAAGGDHHPLGLTTWERQHGSPPPSGAFMIAARASMGRATTVSMRHAPSMTPTITASSWPATARRASGPATVPRARFRARRSISPGSWANVPT